jgi:hypothetical protein
MKLKMVYQGKCEFLYWERSTLWQQKIGGVLRQSPGKLIMIRATGWRMQAKSAETDI